MFTGLLILVVFLLQVAALLFAVRAAATARTSQGAVAWVVFLVSAPYLAVPAYLFLGHHRYRGYQISRRDSALVIEGIRQHALANSPERSPAAPDTAAFEAVAQFPVVRGNAMTLLQDGAATFDAIFAAIDGARSYVLVQFYIIHDDEIGRAFAERLKDAARRGVTVRLLYDRIGSYRLPDAYLAGLREAGVIVNDPRDLRGPRFRFSLNYRNHRKSVIVDGDIGFTGGLNVGDEYMGRDPAFGAWRDTHVRLTGPVVTQLQLVFCEDWHWTTGENLYPALSWNTDHAPENMNALISPTGPADELESGGMFLFAAISAARQRLWIASPYFVPDTDILTALKHAALRGVDVRILVPEVIDHRITWLAAFAYFDEVRDAGARFWRYKEGFMHQKVVLVDDTLAAVGTANLDNRSFRLNFETMALFFDSRAAAETAQMLEGDFARAELYTRPFSDLPVWVRLGASLARLFSPIL